jgi:hypothetical protein
MDALETLVRDTLADHAADAPSDDRLLAAVTEAPRRRPWLAGGLAAALVLGIAVGAVVLRNPGHHAAVAAPSVAAGYRSVSYHGITVEVPNWLGTSYSWCVPPRNEVVAEDGIARMCPALPRRKPPGVVVSLGTTTFGSEGYADLATTPVLVDGHPAKRGYGRLESGYDRLGNSGTIVMTDSGVVVGVSAPTRSEIDSILNSVRVTPIDALGCVDQQPPMDDARYQRVPADPKVATACAYSTLSAGTKEWLIGSARVTGDRPSMIVTAAHDWIGQTGPRSADQPMYLITLAYKDGSTRTIVTAAPQVGRIVGIS